MEFEQNILYTHLAIVLVPIMTCISILTKTCFYTLCKSAPLYGVFTSSGNFTTACFMLVWWDLTSLLNISGHITIDSSGTLTNMLPHRNVMPQTQDMTPTTSHYTDTETSHWITTQLPILKDKYPNFEVGLKCIIMVF